jgi:hypothetical protein
MLFVLVATARSHPLSTQTIVRLAHDSLLFGTLNVHFVCAEFAKDATHFLDTWTKINRAWTSVFFVNGHPTKEAGFADKHGHPRLQQFVSRLEPRVPRVKDGAMLGAVLEGFPPGSLGAKKLGGVYRACGEHAGLPRFSRAQGAAKAHMYRYRSASDAVDSWLVRAEFVPGDYRSSAKVASLPGGAVPEHGHAGVQWSVLSSVIGMPNKDGKHYWVPDQPLVLTALVCSHPRHSPRLLYVRLLLSPTVLAPLCARPSPHPRSQP